MPEETPPPPPSPGAIDAALVRELAQIIGEAGLAEIEVEHGDLRIRLTRTAAPIAALAAPHLMAPPPLMGAPAAWPVDHGAPAPAPAPAAPALPAGEQVKSPMVGTAYLQPAPGAAPFVKVGDKVEAGQTLLLVEAMKTMNPIPAPRAGVITAFLIGDGEPVEYNQPLAVIG